MVIIIIMLICFGGKMNSNLIVTKNTKWMIKTKKEGEHEVDMTRKRSKL